MEIKNFLQILFCLLLVACKTVQPVHVRLNYIPGNEQKRAMLVDVENTHLSVAKIEIFDKRIDQEYLGSTDVPIYGTGVVEWVREGIASLSEFGHSFPNLNVEGDGKELTLMVYVNRTSCRGTIMHVRCTVLIDVDFFFDGKLIQKKSYYGSQIEDKNIILSIDTRHFGEKAILRGLNKALEKCLLKFESDLRNIKFNLLS